jgi:phosphoglucosamine mutase
MLESALASGLISVGADPYLLGPIPTPGVAYLTKSLRVDAGIMISASHNTYEDNGIKFFDSNGYKFSTKEEEEMEALFQLESFDHELVSSDDIGKATRIDDALSQYSVFLKESFPKALSLEGKKVVIDAAHGAAYKVAPKVFKELGAQVTMIHDEPNGFNINANCGALHPQSLAEKVLEVGADIGIALDGDADRIVVVDEKGHILNGDKIIALCALHLKKQGALKNNGVCVTLMSNLGFDLLMKKEGIQVFRTNVGDKYILEELLRQNCSLGGEQSGHILFLDHASTGDGILAGLKLLEIMTLTDKPLSHLAHVMEEIPQLTKSFEVPAKPPLESLSNAQALLANFTQKLKDEGRIIARYSGTENKMRITIESQDPHQNENMMEELYSSFIKDIKSCLKK